MLNQKSLKYIFNNKMSGLKEIIREKLKLTSIHGLANVFRNQNILIKTMWIILFFMSTGGCGWFLNKTIFDFFKNDVVSNTKIM